MKITNISNRNYMRRLIQTCHKRNAPATTGMVPFVLAQAPPDQDMIQQTRYARNICKFVLPMLIKGKTYEAQVFNKSVVISNPIYLMHQLGVFHYACNYTTPVITAGPPDVSVRGLLNYRKDMLQCIQLISICVLSWNILTVGSFRKASSSSIIASKTPQRPKYLIHRWVLKRAR